MKGNKKIESFDDIIFKNRNKEYGAYYLRRRYHRNLIPGIVISILIPIILVILQSLKIIGQDINQVDELTQLYQDAYFEQMQDLQAAQLNEPPKKTKLEDNSLKQENLVPKVVDSLDKSVKEDIKKGLTDSLNLHADTSSVASNGTLNGTEGGTQMIYFEADTLPEFQGGNLALIRFMMKNIKYPEQAHKNNITGIVYIRFCVRSDGSIDKIQLLKGVNPLLDNEALRVVKSMPKWKPGRLRNKNIPVWFTLPINFNLGPRSS